MAQAMLHVKEGLWAVDTVNGNCCDGTLGYLEKSTADVVLAQELRTAEACACQAAERAAARAGWCMSVAKAVRTDRGGISA
eukprot:6282472-Karenia_brevis.AAC.1